jgi:hypothetical protein
MLSHDTTRGMIQLISKLKMIQEDYSPSSSDNNKSFLLPTELVEYIDLSSGFSTEFPLHKGFPSLINSPLATSPCQCRFMSSKHQVVSLYCSSLDPGLLCLGVINLKSDEFLIFFKGTFHFLPFFNLHCEHLCSLCSQPMSLSLIGSAYEHSYCSIFRCHSW